MIHLDYLGALAPRGPSTSVYGAMTFAVVQPLADPRVQPARLYNLFRRGGGVVFKREAAAGLESRGFTVGTFEPTSAERAYLASQDPVFAKADPIWSVSCALPSTVDAQGQRRCGLPGVVEEIEESEGLASGMVDQADLAAPFRHVHPSSVAGYKLFATTPGYLPPIRAVERALDTVKRLEALRIQVDDLTTRQLASGLPMEPGVETRLLDAARLLAMFAQPVEELTKGYEGLRERMVAAGVPGSDRLPADPFPRFGEPVTLSASALAALAVVAILVVAAAAAVVVLAHSWNQVVQAGKELDEAAQQQRQQLLNCIGDAGLTPRQRRGCQDALRELGRQEDKRRDDQPNPFADVADMLRYAVPLAGLAFAAVYLGPVIKEAVGAGAEQIGRFRQTRKPLALADKQAA